jgi:hypothetical protein
VLPGGVVVSGRPRYRKTMSPRYRSILLHCKRPWPRCKYQPRWRRTEKKA